MKTESIFIMREEKKHSVRYDAEGNDPNMTGIYVMKHALPRPYPVRLRVTVEPA